MLAALSMHRQLLLSLFERRLLLSFCLALLALSESAVAVQRQKVVLVLYSTGREAGISEVGQRQFPRLLDRGLERRLDYHSEYIDAGRFSDIEYQTGFRDFLDLKYRGLKIDAVIAIFDVAVDFMSKYRDELFPETPVIYFSLEPIRRPLPNSTGVIANADLGQTIELVRALQPDVDQVFVVNGTSARDKGLEARAGAQFKRFEPAVAFTYFSGLPSDDLMRQLAALPDHSVVFYGLVNQDGRQNFQPLEYLDRMALVSNRPIYSWVDSALGRGIVGGAVQQLDVQVAATAEVTLRVLRGEPADAISPATVDAKSFQVDWRQVRRWDISESRIPAGTVIRNREISTWERYGTYVLAASAIVVAQAVLIFGLLVQGAKRRRAEQEVARSHSELRTSSERVRDLSRRLLSAQDEERARIAYELHDDLGQRIARLSMDLQLLGDSGRFCDSARADLVREAQSRTGDIAQRVHDLSHRLHPEKLRVIGLVPALESLRRDLKPNIDLTFHHKQVPSGLPANVTVCLFRVAEEALLNILKHSDARTGTMSLVGNDSSLSLSIADSGRGFEIDSAWRKGFGLMSIKERVESIGGGVTIASQPGGGTRLEIVVPLASDTPDVLPLEPAETEKLTR